MDDYTVDRAISETKDPFERLWSPGTLLFPYAADNEEAVANLRAGTSEVAGLSRPLHYYEESEDLYAWQFGSDGGAPLYLAVRRFTGSAGGNPNTRIDNPTLVRGDDFVNFMLSAAGQAALAVAGYDTVPVPDAPPIPDFDVNLDGGVSVLDIGIITGRWAETSSCPGWIRADVNNDGGVSVLDLGQVTGKWGETGFVPPSPVPSCEGSYPDSAHNVGWFEGGQKWGATSWLTNGPMNICGNPTQATVAGSFAWSAVQGGGSNSIVQVGVGRCRKLLSGECDGARKVLYAWGREGTGSCLVRYPFPQEIATWDGSPDDATVQLVGSDWVLTFQGNRKTIPYSYTSCSWTPSSATFFTETWNDGDSNGGYDHAKYAIRHMAYQNAVGGAFTYVNTSSCNIPGVSGKHFCTASGDTISTWTVQP